MLPASPRLLTKTQALGRPQQGGEFGLEARAVAIRVVAWMQAELVAAVRGGLLSLEEACERYTLTVDEFLSWQRTLDRHGLPGLRATRVQDYRE